MKNKNQKSSLIEYVRAVYEQQKYEVKVPITKYKNVTYYEPVKEVRYKQYEGRDVLVAATNSFQYQHMER